MVITDPIELRALKAQKWKTPEIGLKQIQYSRLFAEILPAVGGSRSWRKGRFKKYHEEHLAALFVYGIKQITPNYNWQYSYGERADYDCVIRCDPQNPTGSNWVYKPLQLKEVVPNQVSPTASLQQLLNDLPTYSGQDLVVAICVNRPTTINFKELTRPNVRFGQLWLYGPLHGRGWFIVGDLLRNPERHDFDYPVFELESPTSTDLVH